MLVQHPGVHDSLLLWLLVHLARTNQIKTYVLCHNWQHITDGVAENIFLSSSSQPSLLSAEPLLPPHNFHSHSLRRLPLYQPLHISQPMPVSLSVGQPTLPPLPGHHRVLPAHTSLSPPQVPPFLSLPRQQSSYRIDQVCLKKCWLMLSLKPICMLNCYILQTSPLFLDTQVFVPFLIFILFCICHI